MFRTTAVNEAHNMTFHLLKDVQTQAECLHPSYLSQWDNMFLTLSKCAYWVSLIELHVAAYFFRAQMKAQVFSWEELPVRWQSANDESPSVGRMKGQPHLFRWQHLCDSLPKATMPQPITPLLIVFWSWAVRLSGAKTTQTGKICSACKCFNRDNIGVLKALQKENTIFHRFTINKHLKIL